MTESIEADPGLIGRVAALVDPETAAGCELCLAGNEVLDKAGNYSRLLFVEACW